MIDKMIEFLENYDGLENQRFLRYAQKINGLVGPGSVEMLNGCAKYIDQGNCYFEVGTFQGMSLIGASMDNEWFCPCGNPSGCVKLTYPGICGDCDEFLKSRMFYGVENFFEEFKDNWEKYEPTQRSNKFILESNLVKHHAINSCKVFYQDYREFFLNRKDINGAKVEVYLYDGPHAYAHQVAGLLLVIPILADRAIVFIDDYKCENVPRSIERVLAMNNGYIREIKHWVDPYEDFREGFVALEFNRG